jgi:hypothetical protein
MIIGPQGIFLDVKSFSNQLSVLASQVCLLRQDDSSGMTTGFLVAPDLVLTTAHFLTSWTTDETHGTELIDRRISAIFEYVADGIQIYRGKSYSLATTNWLVDIDQDLDYALLRLEHPAGKESISSGAFRGWIRLPETLRQPIEKHSPLIILHHPVGEPLKLSINTDAILGWNDNQTRLFYQTNTLPGSGGAPCFGMNLQLIAVHTGSARPRKEGDFFGNEGVLATSILHRLQEKELHHLVAEEPPVGSTELHPESKAIYTADVSLDYVLRELIQKGESQTVEFKETAFLNLRTQTKDGNQRSAIVETVASFMNRKEGGILFIGIDNNGRVIGINQEYPVVNPQRANWDSYQSFLTNILVDSLEGNSFDNKFRIERYTEEGKDICCIKVVASDAPVYIKGDFFLRIENQTRKLNSRDSLQYVRANWKDKQ